MAQKPRKLVRFLIWAARLPGLLALLGVLALIGSLWVTFITETGTVGVVVFVVWLVFMGVCGIVGLRLGLKYGERLKKQMEDYREGVRTGRYHH